MSGERGQVLERSFYERDPVIVARDLLGMELCYASPAGAVAGYIVETEAYHGHRDAASHAYRGQTKRNAVMFGPAGYAYIYFTYGMHHCLNAVAGAEGEPAAILIRAVHPSHGIQLMLQRRRPLADNQAERPLRDLVNGPGKLCQAFGLSRDQNGIDLTAAPLTIRRPQGLEGAITVPMPDHAVVVTRRIGITRDTGLPWRFYLRGDPFVSARDRGAEHDLEASISQAGQDHPQGERTGCQ